MPIFDMWYARPGGRTLEEYCKVAIPDEVWATAHTDADKVAIAFGHAWGHAGRRWAHEGDGYEFGPARVENDGWHVRASSRYAAWDFCIKGDIGLPGPW